jgi:hypothetical protein
MRSIGIGAPSRQSAPFNPVVRVMNNRMCDIDVLKGNRRRGIGGVDEDSPDPSGTGGEDMEQWSQLWAWVKAVVPDLLHLLHFGPSYTPANGGEVGRQLGVNLGKPWANAYLTWLQTYAPDVWSGRVSQWDAPGWAQESRWHDAYMNLVAQGMPEGALVDANMHPMGMAAVVAAANATNNVQTGGAAPTPAQLQALQILALQICGVEGAAQAAQAQATVNTMPPSWQEYVRQMVAAWQASNNTDPDTGEPAKGGTSAIVLAAVAAKLLGLF